VITHHWTHINELAGGMMKVWLRVV